MGGTPVLISAVLILMLMLSTPPQHQATATAEFLELECLSVPNTVFANRLVSTIDVVSKAISVVSKFVQGFGNFRLANAILDCLDLLQLSTDELSWTLSASQTGKTNGTGHTATDLKTWLSAALINQETCMDGFEGTNYFVKEMIAGSLNQITSLVREVLYMVHDAPRPNHNSSSRAGGKPGGGRRLMNLEDGDAFPSWVSSKDRKLLQATGVPAADVVVAADGSGNFTTVADAIAAAPDHSNKRFVIHIKKGVYNENVEIKRKKTNIMVMGDGMDVTVITSNRSFIGGWTTFRTATFAVTGAGFIARDLTIQNTAGPENHQAVAFRSDSDLSAYYRCAFRGYQDTLYTHANRQFYRECTITGTVDFIFGDAVAVLQNCQILARKGLPNQKNTITAQGRKDPGEITGFSIQFCNISADSELLQASVNATPTYLGRPWKQFSRTIIMESYMSNVVRPEGWLAWNGDLYLDTLFYAEYMNSGPGAGLGSRVQWPGYHNFSSSAQAMNYTVGSFIDGNLWLPQTGVRYSAGLTV